MQKSLSITMNVLLNDYFSAFIKFILHLLLYAVKAQTSLAPLSRFRGSRVTTAHAHQYCIFQSYAIDDA